MSFLFAAPDALAAAASDLAGIGSTLSTANAAALAPTSAVAASAADGVSAQVAEFLSQHGLGYQQVSAQIAKAHEQFVQTLSAGANAYQAAEANAAQTLAGAVNAPVATLLGGGAGGGAAGAVGAAGGAGLFGGGAQAIAGQVGSLLLRPTAGLSALTAAGALLAPAAVTNAAVAPAANALVSIGDAIESAYLAIEPWVQYGFNVAAWAAGWVPWIGFLVGPQINFLYYLFEPMVQAALFNTIDVIDGTLSFAQGFSNFWSATTASVNQFINTEINWVLGFLPPLPPIGVNAP